MGSGSEGPLINPLWPLFINLPPVKSVSEIVDVLLMFVAQFMEPIICGPKVWQYTWDDLYVNHLYVKRSNDRDEKIVKLYLCVEIGFT